LARLFSPVSFGFFIVTFGLSVDGGLSLTVANISGDISYLGGPQKLGFVVVAGGLTAEPDAGRGGGGVVTDGAGVGGGGGGVIPDGAGVGGGGGGVIPDGARGGCSGGGGDCWGGNETHPVGGASDCAWNCVGAGG